MPHDLGGKVECQTFPFRLDKIKLQKWENISWLERIKPGKRRWRGGSGYIPEQNRSKGRPRSQWSSTRHKDEGVIYEDSRCREKHGAGTSTKMTRKIRARTILQIICVYSAHGIPSTVWGNSHVYAKLNGEDEGFAMWTTKGATYVISNVRHIWLACEALKQCPDSWKSLVVVCATLRLCICVGDTRVPHQMLGKCYPWRNSHTRLYIYFSIRF